jgi:4-hydroxy-4-methyl-2-oxoglutarate aldolase
MKNLFNQFFLKECELEYCSGIFSDELDKMGYNNQVAAGWKLNNTKARIFGKIRTIKVVEMDTADEQIKIGLGFLGSLKPGEIMVVKGSNKFAYFGELMSRLSEEVGIDGVMIDGLTRDTYYTQSITFPVFAKGYTPVDIKGRGRVEQPDSTIFIEDIKVNSGDYVFADSDAAVFIPKDVLPKLIERVNSAALEELEIKNKIANGVPISEILLSHKEF